MARASGPKIMVQIPTAPSTELVGITTTTSSSVIVGSTGGRFVTPKQNVEDAVYRHIQAIRALGRTRINTIEIAEALGLPTSEVEKVVSALTKRGVRVV